MSVTGREDLDEIRDLARSVATGRIAPTPLRWTRPPGSPPRAIAPWWNPSCTPSSSPRLTVERAPTH
jgi:hypothetical protein